MKISRIFHAGYIFEADGVRILFDPILETPFSFNCYANPDVSIDLERFKLQGFDAVFISHFHDDHFSLESLQHLDSKVPIYIFCSGDLHEILLRELGFVNVKTIKVGDFIDLGGLRIRVWPALEVEVDSIFEILSKDTKVLHVVDSWMDWDTHKELVSKGPWDLILWPFQTLREIDCLSPRNAPEPDFEIPIEWQQQIGEFSYKYIVPSSCQFSFEPWSWMNKFFFPISYQSFSKTIKQISPNAVVQKMEPGEVFLLSSSGLSKGISLDFVKRKSASPEIAYGEVMDSKDIPSLQQISKHFPVLNFDQTAIVEQFLKEHIIHRYEANPSADAFFKCTRPWLLRIHWESSRFDDLYFEVNSHCVSIVEVDKVREVEWFTEIVAFKLWSALTQGESLSSLYIRINDTGDDVPKARTPDQADVLQDPLLRALFFDSELSYQRAQLRRIKPHLA